MHLDKEDKEDKECLITLEPLEDNYILLPCGHCFNYEPMYYELAYQKTQKILDNYHLKINEIKCPYCRSVSSQILPYFKHYNLKLISGVNMPSKYSMKIYTCEYINRNNKVCGGSACKSKFGYLCNTHYLKQLNKETLNNGKDKKKNNKNNKNLLNNDTNIENKETINNNIEATSYAKLTIPQLKHILRINKCRVGGRKAELLERIKITKLNKTIWVE